MLYRLFQKPVIYFTVGLAWANVLGQLYLLWPSPTQGVFDPHLDPKGGGEWEWTSHLTPVRQVQLKWNFDSGYICIWMSLQKSFVCIVFVLFTLLPWQKENPTFLFPDFVTIFLKFVIKSLIYSKGPVNPKQARLFADWYGQRGQNLPPSVISVWILQLIWYLACR